MAYYFFHHPLDSRDGVPGRYPFDVIGLIASRERVISRERVKVVVDGLGENYAGDNIDPCPIATPVAMVHSFCKIDRWGGKYYVFGTKKVLSEVVLPGDRIIYGHLRTRAGCSIALYIDTILVVESTPVLATNSEGSRPYKIQTGASLSHSLKMVLPSAYADSWALFEDSDLYRNNLIDSAPRRSHEYTRVNPHRVIVGTGVPSGMTPIIALDARTTSFVCLVDTLTAPRLTPPNLLDQPETELRNQLNDWIKHNPRMLGSMKPPSLMSNPLGELIYDLARDRSGRGGRYAGFVAVPPLEQAS